MNASSNRTGNPKSPQKGQAADQEYEDTGPGSISGNLVYDPEMRFTPSGRGLCTMRVCDTPRIKNPDTGKWDDGEPTYLDVTVWGEQGERCAEYLRRADRVVVVGRLQARHYTDRNDERQTRTTLIATDIGPSMLFRGVKVLPRTRNGQQS